MNTTSEILIKAQNRWQNSYVEEETTAHTWDDSRRWQLFLFFIREPAEKISRVAPSNDNNSRKIYKYVHYGGMKHICYRAGGGRLFARCD